MIPTLNNLSFDEQETMKVVHDAVYYFRYLRDMYQYKPKEQANAFIKAKKEILEIIEQSQLKEFIEKITNVRLHLVLNDDSI
jgi:hypothetical protein